VIAKPCSPTTSKSSSRPFMSDAKRPRHNKRQLADLIRPLREQRLTHTEIGKLIGYSRQRVQSICKLFGIEKRALLLTTEVESKGEVG
jgi:hypothetical protein